MKFPKLRSAALSRQTVDVFGGYNHNLRIGENEFYEMVNMSSDGYPVLSPRKGRGSLPTAGTVTGLVSNQGLCRVEEGRFLLPDGRALASGLDSRPKTLISMGAYVIILPDKKWVNVAACMEGAEEDVTGDMEASCQISTINPCKANGEKLDNGALAVKKPADPEDGKLWMDMSLWPPVLRKWCVETGLWEEEKSYVRLECPGIGELFEKGDGLVADFLEFHNDSPYIHVYIPENPTVVETGEDFIVVGGVSTNGVAAESVGGYTASRSVPDMDYVFECGNRLWGCKYGITQNGFVNEIYACKLGDFKNWHSFQGISTDSYVASIGADGPFTGAISYQGHPVFFKEDCVIEVFGSYPAEFRLQVTPGDGVQQGCHKSLAIVNNILYYKSKAGICAFDGSLPVQAGQALGQVFYKNAASGALGSKYYISMEGDTGWSLFVFDAARGLWHREDGLQVLQFCTAGNILYCLTAEGIVTVGGNHEGEPVSWLLQTGDVGLSLPEMKYISRLSVRLQLDIGARVSFYVRYDHAPGWEHLFTLYGTDLHSFSVPIRPRRCDSMQLKLEGVGEAKVYSVTKVIERGSEPW